MTEKYHREITQLTPKDCFMVFDRVKDKFPFPLHFHPDYELNFIYNGKGVRRIVGMATPAPPQPPEQGQ